MTDISTEQQSLSLPAAPAHGLRFPRRLLKLLPGFRRTCLIDTTSASQHRLEDVGLHRARDIPRIASLGRLW